MRTAAYVHETDLPAEQVQPEVPHAALLAAVQELPERFRATAYLTDILGYSCQNAAEVIGVPVGTVKSRLDRARDQVRERLASEPSATCAAESVTKMY